MGGGTDYCSLLGPGFSLYSCRVTDNIFIERLWWTIKHHYLYLHAFNSGSELRRGLSRWVRYYNKERGHSSLDDRTPDEVYYDLPLPYAEAA